MGRIPVYSVSGFVRFHCTYYGIISVIKKHYGTDDLEMKPPLITNMMKRKDISKYIYKYFIEKDEKENL